PSAHHTLYTLSLHDALPISRGARGRRDRAEPDDRAPRRRGLVPIRGRRRLDLPCAALRLDERLRPRALRRGRDAAPGAGAPLDRDRKSTRLNSSHVAISYAV